jgi:hypothetical protein
MAGDAPALQLSSEKLREMEMLQSKLTGWEASVSIGRR